MELACSTRNRFYWRGQTGMYIRTLHEIVNARRTRGAGEFSDWLLARLERYPRCAFTRYILGCQCFDRGRVAQGVRHMMVAHHSSPAIESAALLVFSGLNWVRARGAPLLPVLLDTWEEFRRPAFDRNSLEMRMLDAFDEPLNAQHGLSPLARRLWRLPIRTLRTQIRDVMMSPDGAGFPMLWATA
jgi:hypothetical protein